MRLFRAPVALVVSLTLALTMTGCIGLSSASSFVPGANPGSVKAVPSLKGVTLTVGSKDFTEQLILGKMAVILLRVAGADVVDKTNIQGSNAVRKAQESGAIDIAWEYTGTSWISYNGHENPIRDQQKQWQVVHDEDLRHNIQWLPMAPLNDTYAFGVRAAEAKKLGVTKLSDLSKLSTKDLSFCVESEFASRNDGFPGALRTYGIPLGSKVSRSNVHNLDTGVVYTATAKGTCNFGEVFTTDGRINGLHLTVLADDKHFFPNYNVAVNVYEPIYKKHPEIAKVFDGVTKKLTNEQMAVMTAQVDMEGADPAIVAHDWLKKNGFVS
ncbi:MAG: glycine betaine ABC transporter substrate-binding protein [Streptosporangiales bacterium]|nr:glycine betaine ABC transporter substrate-binding protein [Streptosporangiales bacterium]MBO0889910.1 glycine betaine ABC transporter substrate-binding protein [Acidothermales bacterium]